MTKRKWVTTGIIVTLVVVAAFGVVRFRNQKNTKVETTTAVRTTQVQRRTLSSSVDASGDLQALHEEALYQKVAGKVTEVLVKPGQLVSAGQVLVKLTSSDARTAVDDAQDDLEVAKARLATARDNYNNAPKNAQITLQKARQELYSAKLKQEELLAGAKAQDAEQARANLRQAQITLATAKDELNTETALYKTGAVTRVEYDGYVNKVTIAQDNVTNAQLKLNTLLEGATQKEKDSANSLVQQAEINLNMAEDAAAKAASKESLIQAEAEVRKAEKVLQTAQDNLASLTIKAPFAGMVASVNATVGKELAAGSASNPVVKLAANDRWQVVAYVDEADVSQLEVGQRVEVTLSALEDKTFTGQLSAIGAEAKVSQSVVSYPIYVDLTNFNPVFRTGMSADAVVQIVYKPNVLVLPDATIQQRRGRPMVQILGEGEDAKPIWIRVETGEKGDGYTEILSGVEEGQVVIQPGRQSTSAQQGNQSNQNGSSNRAMGAGAMMFMGAPR